MKQTSRILGVDFGQARVGLAVTDPDRRIASPLATYQRRDVDKDSVYFKELVQAEEIGLIVVGLPMHTDGREGMLAAEARKFGGWLSEVTSIPIVYFDERFTTVEAEQHLRAAGLSRQKRKARRDRIAAQIILQAFIEAGHHEPDASATLRLR